MDKLLPYYEQELGILRRACQGFAQARPILAAELGLTADGSADADVERLLQSIALLNASLARRLDMADHRLTGPVLNNLQPHVARPLPAFGVAQLESPATTQLTCIPRGAEFDGDDRRRYRSSSELTVAPLQIQSLRYLHAADLPGSLKIPTHAAASIELVVRSSVPGEPLSTYCATRLRLYADAPPPLRTLLLDAILLSAIAVCVESEGHWKVTDVSPFSLPAPDEDSCLVPGSAGPGRLLTEYFHYPEKFAFLDFDLASLLRLFPHGQEIRVVLPLPRQRNSEEARLLAELDRRHLRQGCAPLVNLYRAEAASIRLVEGRSEYRLLPADGKHVSAIPYRIDSVTLRECGSEEDRKIELYDGINHHSGPLFWRLGQSGNQHTLQFVDECGERLDAGSGALTVKFTATNRPGGEKPERLTIGGSPALRIRVLSYSPQCELSDDHWSLLEPRRIGTADSLRGLLSRCGGARNAALARAVLALQQQDTTAWCRYGKEARYLCGTDTRIVIDQEQLSDCSLYLFAQLMSRCFSFLMREDCFSRVILVSAASGKEIVRCLPQPGAISLI
ncbi:type VI secretion system baseplate subunit TssF [Massilia endophytica]|uniref:type VI secretion system baseplate subunit TssF n=1 Tax=Massilia endophytica TaxID=2899220 RepID=UPI001E4C5250|nr:type VI secretion system baseplate subunit TssF [Massilia endophytica]UGQ48197.1 type VI secretion system baseplate subunit TssF [Massilia endophytica]